MCLCSRFLLKQNCQHGAKEKKTIAECLGTRKRNDRKMFGQGGGGEHVCSTLGSLTAKLSGAGASQYLGWGPPGKPGGCCQLLIFCAYAGGAACQKHRVGKDAHAGSRTRVTSMGGLYDTATLHALVFKCTHARTKHAATDYAGSVQLGWQLALHKYQAKQNDPSRTRTCNLWFRKPTSYPLGHGASAVRLAGENK